MAIAYFSSLPQPGFSVASFKPKIYIELIYFLYQERLSLIKGTHDHFKS